MNEWADSSSPFFLLFRFFSDPERIPRMSWQTAVETTVTGLGYELVDCERSAGGLLRVTIDKLAPQAAAGELITVDDCEKVTRQLQYVLEVEAFDYARLEVSSPGLDRPLRNAAHYARFAGQEIDITLKLPFQGRKKYRGIVSAQPGATNDQAWRLVFDDGAAEQALDFTLDEVRDAKLVPVISFKGRGGEPAPDRKPGQRGVIKPKKAAKKQAGEPSEAAPGQDKVDGGLKQ
ncbi:ribosome maturation factor RimP [Roseateles asaccharophilus]|uniref:Ribosome maturation factor RimP n=2 Tax=Roseateles asaccharophilus TaxID=582607 RepID=A0ABU2ABN3_9BURK|nr:ribosome maturation factor RimP [Roseateles asaccharophilus]